MREQRETPRFGTVIVQVLGGMPDGCVTHVELLGRQREGLMSQSRAEGSPRALLGWWVPHCSGSACQGCAYGRSYLHVPTLWNISGVLLALGNSMVCGRVTKERP